VLNVQSTKIKQIPEGLVALEDPHSSQLQVLRGCTFASSTARLVSLDVEESNVRKQTRA
jgi:hypothetical protein